MSWLAIHWNDDQQEAATTVLQRAEGLLAKFPVKAAADVADELERIGFETVERVEELRALIEGPDSDPPVALLLFEDRAIGGGGEVDALIRDCLARNIALALNPATAEAVFEALRAKRRAVMIFNPISGSGNAEKEHARILELLEPSMMLDVKETTPEVDAGSLAREALKAGVDLVIAAGGDGTVSEVAEVLTGTDIPLAIIPRGTANALAVALFGPQLYLDPIGRSCEAILDGVTRTIDTVKCGDHQMLLLAGIGVESGMVERAERDLKARFGVLAYLVGGWEQIKAQEEFDVELECDGKRHRFRSGSVVVANAAPPSSVFAQGSGTPIYDDGMLDVTTLVDVKTPWEAVQTIMQLFQAGLTQQAPEERVITMRAAKVRVETNPPQTVAIDGELVGQTPVEFEVVPASLKVIVPKHDDRRQPE
ncbi:YegS/Rv2252/BmrU family lipid kinase [Tautonia rosea]|uniref:YegS/Rv2252/BmrU family lipid kinase n=1 Tax=Tautonia rosea TaxID=2728037 RepID=UPI00147379DA|nr:YegS/Rv2252/BmrU family lipid kinase [Tautonia rosea]